MPEWLSLLSEQEPDQVWGGVLQRLADEWQAEGAVLIAWKAPAARPQLLATHRVPETWVSWALAEQGGVTLLRRSDEPRWIPLTAHRGLSPAVRRSGLRALLVCPLRQGERLIGGLLGFFRRSRPRPDTGEELRAVLRLLALLVRSWQLQQQLAFWQGMQEDLRQMVLTELRDPLYQAMEAANELRREAGPPGPLAQPYWETLEQAHNRMAALVQGFLEFQELATSGQLRRDRHDLKELLSQVLAEVQVLAEQKQVQLLLQLPDEPVEVLGDGLYLRKMLAHLIRNALNFTPPEKSVRVSLQQEEEWGVFTVQDEGPGISPEEAERVFRPFHRLPGAAEVGPGAGIGLSLVEQVAIRHGGEVRLQSRPGKGSLFVVRLPLVGEAG